MKRLIFVALFLLKAAAFADPAGLVQVKKGTEPAWLSVTATAEQNRATYVIRVNKDKGIDVDKLRFALRFQVPEYGDPAFLIPVELHQDKTGLDAILRVPEEVARKGILYLGVESREVKNGQASYLISMSSYTMSSYTSTLEYIEKTGTLWGVKELALDAKGKVTLVDARESGYGSGLMMFDSRDKLVAEVVLSPTQSCSLSDGDHAFIKYELKDVKDGIVTFVVTDKFDARSFGKDVTEKVKTVQVKPYKGVEEGPLHADIATLRDFANSYEPKSTGAGHVPSLPDPSQAVARVLKDHPLNNEYCRHVSLVLLKLDRFHVENFHQSYDLRSGEAPNPFLMAFARMARGGDEWDRDKLEYLGSGMVEHWIALHTYLAREEAFDRELKRIRAVQDKIKAEVGGSPAKQSH